jgi:formylglycine-generating enzyme required for sulfatase activity
LADLFLSYAREDGSKAELLVSALQRQGWSVFWEIADGTADNDAERDKAIEQAGCVIVAWSNVSKSTIGIRGDAALGLLRKKLLPILFEPVEPPGDFRNLHTEDLSSWRGDSNSPEFLSLQRAIESLLKAEAVAIEDEPPKNPDHNSIRFKFKHVKTLLVVLVVLASIAMAWPKFSSLVFEQMPSLATAGERICQFIPGQGPEMVVIPAGSFMMGEQRQQHQVTIAKPFAVSRCEITFADYQPFVTATQREPPDDSGWGKEDRPVINVSWDDAVAYAQWLSKVTGRSYRLPSDAEWEYVARANTTTEFYWGANRAEDYAWFAENANKQSHPVAQKNPNLFGLYDTFGNVLEWVQDCYAEDYKQAPRDGSAWESKDCQYRVLRGGSWIYTQDGLRSADRIRDNPDDRGNDIGFRLAQDLP